MFIFQPVPIDYENGQIVLFFVNLSHAVRRYVASIEHKSYKVQETLHMHSSTTSSIPESYNALESALSEPNGKTEAKDGTETSSGKSLLRNWPLMSSIIVYCIFSLHDMAYSEVQLSI